VFDIPNKEDHLLDGLLDVNEGLGVFVFVVFLVGVSVIVKVGFAACVSAIAVYISASDAPQPESNKVVIIHNQMSFFISSASILV
jgi:hypothetical protein